MLRSLFVAVVLGLLVAVPAVRADDEGYVKVEIKGRFRIPREGYRPVIDVNRETYELELKKLPGGPLTDKQLKEMNGESVIVEGTLRLERNERPRVLVTKIAVSKRNPKP
jgi:hypothetical protein